MGNGNKATDKEQAAAPATSVKKKAPVVPITIGVIVVFIVIAVIASGGANSTEFVNGQVSRTIATVDECASAELALAVPEGETMEDVATAVFEALSRTEGVGLVTVYEENPRVSIQYCQSYANEPALREVLGATGYLAQ